MQALRRLLTDSFLLLLNREVLGVFLWLDHSNKMHDWVKAEFNIHHLAWDASSSKFRHKLNTARRVEYRDCQVTHVSL